MTVAEAHMVMWTFGIFLIALLTYIDQQTK